VVAALLTNFFKKLFSISFQVLRNGVILIFPVHDPEASTLINTAESNE